MYILKKKSTAMPQLSQSLHCLLADFCRLTQSFQIHVSFLNHIARRVIQDHRAEIVGDTFKMRK